MACGWLFVGDEDDETSGPCTKFLSLSLMQLLNKLLLALSKEDKLLIDFLLLLKQNFVPLLPLDSGYSGRAACSSHRLRHDWKVSQCSIVL